MPPPKTVREYLDAVPAEHRAALEAVRKVVRDNLDADYEEGIQYGMIGYYVPHRVFPPGYHTDPKQPLPFASLASRKNYLALYLGCVYGTEQERRFRERWAKSGKKLDMGKTCVRFRRVDDLALDVIARTVKETPVKKFLAYYRAVDPRERAAPAKPKKKGQTRKPAKSK